MEDVCYVAYGKGQRMGVHGHGCRGNGEVDIWCPVFEVRLMLVTRCLMVFEVLLLCLRYDREMYIIDL